MNLDSGNSKRISEDILTTSRSIIRTSLQLRREEDCLVITDPSTSDIGQAIYEAAAEVTDRILMVMMPEGNRSGKEPPAPISELMRKNRAIIIATVKSLTHTRARANASKEGARIISMPGVTKEMMVNGGMTADFGALQREISSMNSIFRRKRNVKVKTEGGTNISFETGNRWILLDGGICNRPGQICNLPAGRIFVMPKENSANGKIVIDGSWEGKMISEPLTLEIDSGLISGIYGGKEAEDFKSILEYVKSGLRGTKKELVGNLSEFGFGMNSRASIIGNKLEDQVTRGTAYFGFGDNIALGGSVSVGFNLKGVMKNPTAKLDDIKLLSDGKVVQDRR